MAKRELRGLVIPIFDHGTIGAWLEPTEGMHLLPRGELPTSSAMVRYEEDPVEYRRPYGRAEVEAEDDLWILRERIKPDRPVRAGTGLGTRARWHGKGYGRYSPCKRLMCCLQTGEYSGPSSTVEMRFSCLHRRLIYPRSSYMLYSACRVGTSQRANREVRLSLLPCVCDSDHDLSRFGRSLECRSGGLRRTNPAMLRSMLAPARMLEGPRIHQPHRSPALVMRKPNMTIWASWSDHRPWQIQYLTLAKLEQLPNLLPK